VTPGEIAALLGAYKNQAAQGEPAEVARLVLGALGIVTDLLDAGQHPDDVAALLESYRANIANDWAGAMRAKFPR
jgi:hypothetical protein